jgi:hypothetical protein
LPILNWQPFNLIAINQEKFMRCIIIFFKLIPVFCILSSCNSSEKYKLDLASENHPTIIIKAAFELGEARDTSAVIPLLKNILDPRMSTNIHFKGMTVCYCKLVALKKITGLKPLQNVNQFEVDTLAANFYYKWAIGKGLIKDGDRLDIYYH